MSKIVAAISATQTAINTNGGTVVWSDKLQEYFSTDALHIATQTIICTRDEFYNCISEMTGDKKAHLEWLAEVNAKRDFAEDVAQRDRLVATVKELDAALELCTGYIKSPLEAEVKLLIAEME